MSTLTEAVQQVPSFLGLGACERSDRVLDGKSHHALLLSGMYRGGHTVVSGVKGWTVGNGGIDAWDHNYYRQSI